MSTRPLTILEAARQDEREAVAYYAGEAGLDVAMRFAETLRDVYGAIAASPGTGSPRYGDLLGIEGLRSRALRRFPYLIFYLEYRDRIEIWRVLQAQRDIPLFLRERDA